MIKNLLLLGISFALALVIFEGVLRLALPANPAPHFYRPHPLLSYELVPDADGYRVGENPEPVSFTVDSRGFRQNVDKGQRQSASRVLILGDSFTEAAQVEPNESFVALIEEDLAERGLDVEVINGGVSGYGTVHQLVGYELKGKQLAADLVVVAFCSGNDMIDNTASFHPDGGLTFDLHEGELLGPQASGKSPNLIIEWARAHTFFYPWLVTMKRLGSGLINGQGDGIAEHGQVFQSDLDSHWDDAWEITRRTFEKLNVAVNASGARLAIAVLPVGFQVYNDPRHQHGENEDIYRVEERLNAIAENSSIAILPMLDGFIAAVGSADESQPLFFEGIGHFTTTGHQLAADLLAPFIAKNLE